MKRRGAKVVSSSSTVVPSAAAPAAADVIGSAPVPPPPPHAWDAASSPAVDVVAATQPALAIPTLNIFARFQRHRDDFDADWLLLKEDPSTGEEKPPLAAHVADKLRRHQAQLGAHRAAAAADRNAARQGKKAADSGAIAGQSGVEAKDEDDMAVVSAEASVAGRRQRRPELYDSAEDERSASTLAVDDAGAESEAPHHEEDDDEVEYVPQDRKASQYRHKSSMTQTSGSPAPADVDVAVVRDSAASEVQASVKVAVAEAEEKLEEGLTGDYLNFQSVAPTGGKALATGELQATVHMPPSSSASASTNAPHPQSQQQQQQQQRRRGRDGANASDADRVMIVPLWSTSRMEQHGGYCRTSPLIALHQEITDLVDYLRPTAAEVTMRRYIEKEMGRLADRLWPGSRVLVYGSMYTHLLLPLSDLDMTLLDVPVPAEEALTALAKEISNEGLCENAYPQVILKTKVPLIKFAHKGSLIDVDISVGAVDGKRNSDCVIRYLNTYPEALPLVTMVKYFLMQRGMHEPYHGGLGSYAATLLVVAFLRQHPIYTTNPEQRPMTGLGKLFVDFLRMCGQYWSYARVAVTLDDFGLSASVGDVSSSGSGSAASVTGKGDFCLRSDSAWGGRMQSPVSPSSPRTPMGPSQGSITDPVDPSNNAASSLRLFHSVSSMFNFAYQALTADFDAAGVSEAASATATTMPHVSSPSCDDITRRPTLLSRIFHVDAEMVFRRQAIATTYARLCTEMPAYMAEVRDFHRAEDAAMLPSSGQSWRERRQQRRGGDGSPFLWEQQPSRSVTSLEERLALVRLHESAQPATADVAAPADGAAGGPARKRQREGEEVDSVASMSSGSGYDSDAESNASSVRVDVTRETQRSRRMRRD